MTTCLYQPNLQSDLHKVLCQILFSDKSLLFLVCYFTKTILLLNLLVLRNEAFLSTLSPVRMKINSSDADSSLCQWLSKVMKNPLADT